jgi:hypothetical protein
MISSDTAGRVVINPYSISSMMKLNIEEGKYMI